MNISKLKLFKYYKGANWVLLIKILLYFIDIKLTSINFPKFITKGYYYNAIKLALKNINILLHTKALTT